LYNRAMGYRKRLLLLMHGDPDAYCQFFTTPADADVSELNKLIKSMGEENYMRLPQVDGTTVFFADQSCAIPETYQSIAVSENAVRDMEFTKFVNTPEGQRISGTLGRPSKDQIEDGKENIEFEVLAINTSAKAEAREACYLEAITIDSLNAAPTTLAELQEAMQRRAKIYGECLVRAKHKISTFKYHIYYRISRNTSSISSSWLRFEIGKEYLASQYIEDYVEWKALVRSVTDPQTISLDEKVSGD